MDLFYDLIDFLLLNSCPELVGTPCIKNISLSSSVAITEIRYRAVFNENLALALGDEILFEEFVSVFWTCQFGPPPPPTPLYKVGPFTTGYAESTVWLELFMRPTIPRSSLETLVTMKPR